MESSQQTSHLVLVSGANGFIATEIVLAFLQAGYRVRGTVRSQAKADAWLALPAIAPYTSSFEGIAPLSVVLVEDITISGAFDEALAGATYFVHTISKLADWRLGAKQVRY
jgi:NADPH-dependent methylglyoxal reductase